MFATDDATGKLQAAWLVEEQLRRLLATGFLAGRCLSKRLDSGPGRENRAKPETNRLYRTVCRWWRGIEVLFVTGATTGKMEANSTAIKHIKRTASRYRNPANYKSVILLRSAVRTAV